jgi:DUF2075 family protein
MILYHANKTNFCLDVLNDTIVDNINDLMVREVGHSVSPFEKLSWRNSLAFMDRVISDNEIPGNASIAIEYHLPQTSKRIDFIITGLNDEDQSSAVIVELKQWSDVQLTEKDGVIKTFLGGGIREHVHPSYQAYTYEQTLRDYNENIEEFSINVRSCAFLHNCNQYNVICDPRYDNYLKISPSFLKNDAIKLRDFIKKIIRKGDDLKTLYLIENGKIRPSKSLQEHIGSLLNGNKEFYLIDDQKIVYESAIQMIMEKTVSKNVMVIRGGPGTGKSVLAVNLLGECLQKGLNALYVSKNSAPRQAYKYKLTGDFKRSRIDHLFQGSGSFCDSPPNACDVLIVDEAHRLNLKSGIFSNKGENQIKEIINAGKNVIFLLDEDQKIAYKDIGSYEEITQWCNFHSVEFCEYELQSQFRCNGSNGYLAWLDSVLEIKETANETLDGINYDFRVFDNMSEMAEAIYAKNKINNRARIVAGYCWDWISKKDESKFDFVIGDFRAKWNLTEDGGTWIVKPDSVKEVGCIHTCQGLEVDYIGVIIGPDLIYRNEKIVTDLNKRSKGDVTVKGGLKRLIKENEEEGLVIADRIIKNTYRTLMTRGMKGCYVFCVDWELMNRLKFYDIIHK